MPPKKSIVQTIQKKEITESERISNAIDDYDKIMNEVVVDAYQPIPLELENIRGYSVGGNQYIPFLGGESPIYGFNNFFNNILNWRLESTTLNACIESKISFSVGNGLYIDDAPEGFNDPIWDAFLKKCNPNGQGLNDILRLIFDNLYTFGNCCIEFVKFAVGGKKFLYVYVKNTLICRKGFPNNYNEVENIIISRFFKEQGKMSLTDKFNISIPLYKMGNPNDPLNWYEDKTDNQGKITGKGIFRTSIWIKTDMPGYDHYGLPNWLPAMRSAILEGATQQFNLDIINNGMVIGSTIVLEGNIDQDEEKRLEKHLRSFAKKGNIGKSLVLSSNSGINGSKVTPHETYKQGSYMELAGLSAKKIIVGCNWDGAFIGESNDQGSKAKSGEFMNELYQQKIKTVIKPMHRLVLAQFVDAFCEISDSWLGTKFSKYDIDIQISNLFDDTTAATTTVLGGQMFLSVIDRISSGAWNVDSAALFVAERFGMDLEEAKAQLHVNVIGNKPMQTNVQPTE